MEVIWTLLLTVCSDVNCLTQDVQWFDTYDACIEMKIVHEDYPPDGHWKSIDFVCTIKGATQI